ncbi:hypothetical protein TB2_032316 [Malus domestica]
MEETSQSLTRVSALIINTFDDLEASILSHIAICFPQVYTIGPLHALLKSHVRSDLSSLATSFGKQFLWSVRSDMLRGEQREFVIPAELEVGTKERGSIVEWVPQEDVLAHKVVVGFLTHSG